MSTHGNVTVRAATVVIALLGGCASARVKPDDMSAAAHRAEARDERRAAATEKRAYDPSQTTEHVEILVDAAAAGGGAVVRTDSNPTAAHLQNADEAMEHAKAHDKAARELENFEDKECAGIPSRDRFACPITGRVTRVETTQDGVRLYPAQSATVADVTARMRCHYAFAQARGFDDSDSCPLYIKGLTIRLSSDQQAIELAGASPTVIAEIQRRTRAGYPSARTH